MVVRYYYKKVADRFISIKQLTVKFLEGKRMCLYSEDFIKSGILWMDDGELKATAGNFCTPAITFLRLMIEEGYNEKRIMSVIDGMVEKDKQDDSVYREKVAELRMKAKELLVASKKDFKSKEEVKRFFGPAGS